MANRHRGRRATRAKGALIWTTIVNDTVTILPAATKTGTDIVADADWTQVSGAERAMIMRVRGWFSVAPDPVLAVTGSFGVFAYIGVYDADEPSLSALLADTYSDEDIMATYGHQFGHQDIGEAPGPQWDQAVDVKAMRKIRRGQELRFVVTNGGSVDIQISLVIRALVKRS